MASGFQWMHLPAGEIIDSDATEEDGEDDSDATEGDTDSDATEEDSDSDSDGEEEDMILTTVTSWQPGRCLDRPGLNANICVRPSRHPLLRSSGGLGLFARDAVDPSDPQVVFRVGDKITLYSSQELYSRKEMEDSDGSYWFDLEAARPNANRSRKVYLNADTAATMPGRYMNDPMGWVVRLDGELHPMRGNAIVPNRQRIQVLPNGQFAVGVFACRDIYEGQEILMNYGHKYWDNQTIALGVDESMAEREAELYGVGEPCTAERCNEDYDLFVCQACVNLESLFGGYDVVEPNQRFRVNDLGNWVLVTE